MTHKIRQVRQSKGLTQDALAAQVGVSRQTIRSFEQNKTSPRLFDLERISRVLGIRLVDLLSVEHTNHSSAA